jgi:redox-sensitive bicupin YhaK (pirin superfamily)
MITVRPRAELGGGDFGWLQALHHFAIGESGNPAHGPIGDLIVWNDDEIAPGTGFPMHSHRHVEIITYVREGAISHRDSLGNQGKTVAGDVQVMSAGTGITHAEFNNEVTTTKIFQIWIQPREYGGIPRWDSRTFPKVDRAGKFMVLASGYAEDVDALTIRASWGRAWLQDTALATSVHLAAKRMSSQYGDSCKSISLHWMPGMGHRSRGSSRCRLRHLPIPKLSWL